MTETRELSERYSRATHSAHLRVDPERCDVDYLIAAGVVKEGLGARLFRLQSEWDLAAGEYRIALRHVREVEMQALQVKRNAARYPSEESAKLLAEADALMTRARNEALTAKVLAMIHLKTLHEAKVAVGAFARHLANKRRFMEPDAVVNRLAAKALQLFLDATCHQCAGRGFNGGFNAARALCTACGASGRSHYHLSKTEFHSAFIRSLLAEMDLKCHRVQQQMSRWLRQRA